MSKESLMNLNFFKNNATPKLHIDLGTCTLPQLKRTKEFFRAFREGMMLVIGAS